MPLGPGARSIAQAQSPQQSDTHCTAAVQLRGQASDAWQAAHSGSRAPVRWQKGRAESWVSPKPPVLPCQAAVPDSCPQPQGQLSPAEELCSPVRPLREHPPAAAAAAAYPCSVATHCSFSAWELQEEKRRREAASGPALPSPWGPEAPCWGQGRDAAQAPAPCQLPEQRLLPLPSGKPKLSSAHRPLSAHALHERQRPWQGCPRLPACHSWQALLPCRGTWHMAPRLTQKWQCTSRWAR